MTGVVHVLIIGEIVGSHGVKGELKVIPHTDFPQRFFELDVVKIQRGKETRQLHIDNVRQHKTLFLLQCREVTHRCQADALKNWVLVVDYQDAVPLPADHYYDYQLLGMEVWDVTGQTLVGTITQVLHLPANAAYQVARPQGQVVLIPALKSVVRLVDVVNKRMEIIPLEGLLE